jgi:hypothetical protein
LTSFEGSNPSLSASLKKIEHPAAAASEGGDLSPPSALVVAARISSTSFMV